MRYSPGVNDGQFVVATIRDMRAAPISGVNRTCYKAVKFDKLLEKIVPTMSESRFRDELQALMDNNVILLWGCLTPEKAKVWGRPGQISWLHPDARLEPGQRFARDGTPTNYHMSAQNSGDSLLEIYGVYIISDGLPQSVVRAMARGHIAFDSSTFAPSAK